MVMRNHKCGHSEEIRVARCCFARFAAGNEGAVFQHIGEGIRTTRQFAGENWQFRYVPIEPAVVTHGEPCNRGLCNVVEYVSGVCGDGFSLGLMQIPHRDDDHILCIRGIHRNHRFSRATHGVAQQ